MKSFEDINAEILAGPDCPTKRFLKGYLEKKYGRQDKETDETHDQPDSQRLGAEASLPTSPSGVGQEGDVGAAMIGRIQEPAAAPGGPMTDWDDKALPMDPSDDERT